MTILVTGAAGFIGFHLCKRLLRNGVNVIGFDNLNNYYDQKLKISRLVVLNLVTTEEDRINSDEFKIISLALKAKFSILLL